MALHMIVVAIVAPLLAVGIAGSRLDPVEKAPALFAAIPASLVELVVVWAWHAPALHHAAGHRVGDLRRRAGVVPCGWIVFLAVGARRRPARCE